MVVLLMAQGGSFGDGPDSLDVGARTKGEGSKQVRLLVAACLSLDDGRGLSGLKERTFSVQSLVVRSLHG
jgi:hypothetical protein